MITYNQVKSYESAERVSSKYGLLGEVLAVQILTAANRSIKMINRRTDRAEMFCKTSLHHTNLLISVPVAKLSVGAMEAKSARFCRLTVTTSV